MHTRPRRTWRRYAPLALMLALAGAVVFEVGLAWLWPGRVRLSDVRFYNRPERPSLAESVIQWQVYNLLTLKQAPEVVIFGDSSALMGVNPKVIAAATGWTVWNFGLVGTVGLAGIVDLIELYLQRHPPPRLLILHVTISRFSAHSPVQTAWALGRFRDWLDRVVHPPMLSHLPSYRLRLFARSPRVWPPFLNQPRGPFPSDNQVRLRLLANHGYLPEERRRGPDHRRLTPRLDDYSRNCEPSLNRLFELSRRRGVAVLIVTPPVAQAARSQSVNAAFNQVENKIVGLARPYPLVHVLHPLVRYYRTDLISLNPNHLLAAGAEKNSLDLARWITHWRAERHRGGRD